MAPIEPDMTLLGELYEEIDRHPPAIEARKLLVDQFIAAEWMETVRDAVRELHNLARHDQQVTSWYIAFCTTATAPPAYTPPPAPGSSSDTEAKSRAKIVNHGYIVKPAQLPSDPEDLAEEKMSLANGYRTFQERAKSLLKDLKHLQGLQSRKKVGKVDREQRTQLEALADGKITTVLRTQEPSKDTSTESTRVPGPARAVALRMASEPANAFTIAMTDLETMVPWLRSIWPMGTPPDEDALRDLLVKRVRMIVSSLPCELQIHVQQALMHMEHEQLKRSYVNTETMYGDAVVDIPRDNFLATEDNYAWDMEELAAAIQANKGVMRNPLSKFMFTSADVKAILQHQHGKPLAALEVEQSRLKQGVRVETLDHMDKMANILLADMEESAKDSREAVDEFIAYVATLPPKEQEALDNLRVPARDSHTGQAFDGSVGDTIRDAKANKLCFHKAADFLQQAARYLRNNR